MPSKNTLKKGALNLQEKVYIAENCKTKTVEDICKKLKRSETYVVKYINKLNPEDEEVVENFKTKDNKLVDKTSGATVLNENGASFPYRPKQYQSKFRTR